MTRINLNALDERERKARLYYRSRRIGPSTNEDPDIFTIKRNEIEFRVKKSALDEYNSVYGFAYEEEIREMYFYPYLEPTMTFVDVGAAYGGYTMHALAAGAQVWAFEPDPRIFYDLNVNVDLNGFNTRFNGFSNALWDSQTRLSFDELEDVPAITLDMTGIRADFIKIDAEGAENHIIRGAMDTIRKHKPKILIENHPLKGGDVQAIKKMLDFYHCEEGPVISDTSFSFFEE